MSRILLIEDNADLAFGLRNNLEIEGHQVEVAPDGERGLHLARTTDPELVILDLMLPDIDGLRILRTLRDADFAAPILVLTARGEEADKVRGLRLGADDYVTKPFGLLEVLARVDALLRRGEHGADQPPIRQFGEVEVRHSRRQVLRRDQLIDLTPKEYDLLIALLRRRGGIATRRELMREVWGYSHDVVTRTVDTHVGELRKKLESDPARPVHILTVRKVGYRLEP